MSKHTTGQWEALPVDLSGWVSIVVRGQDGNHSLPFAACKHFDQEANASLISAAPELLEALVDLVAFYPPGSTDPCVTAARAAIAKAEGKP